MKKYQRRIGGPRSASSKQGSGTVKSELERLLEGNPGSSSALSAPITTNAIPGTLRSSESSIRSTLMHRTNEHGTVSLWTLVPKATVILVASGLVYLAWSWIKKNMGGQP